MDGRRLRGRDTETAALRELLDLVGDRGVAALGMVCGEPGIGKTAVLEAVLDEAGARGLRVSRGKAEESDQIAPLSSLLEAVRGVIAPAGLGGVVLGPDQQFRVVEKLAGLIETVAEQGPVVVAIDDVQWADPLSRMALRMLPARLRASPVCWLLTGRDGFTHIEQVVEAAATALPVCRVSLGPLPPPALREVAADVLGRDADEHVLDLLEGAGGNPFLAVELLEGIGSASPQRLVLGVRRRVRDLPPAALSLLRAGAVLGRRFALPGAQALLELDMTALTGDLDGLLVDDGEHLEFRHDLVRQAVYADIPPSARNALHRAAAVHLYRTAQRPVDAARHLLAATITGDTVGLLRSVAAAVAESLPSVAADLLVRAVDAVPGDAELTEEAVRRLCRAHRHREAVAYAEESSTAEVLVAAGRSFWELQRVAELARRTSQALATGELAPVTRVRLESLRALALSRHTDRAAAWGAAEAALAAAEELADPAATATAILSLVEMAYSEGFNAVALAHLRRLRGLDATVTTWEVIIHQHLDDFTAAQRLIDLARADLRISPAHVLWVQACQSFLLGRFDDMDAEFRTLAELPEHPYTVLCRAALVRSALLRGRLPQARAWLAEARDRLHATTDPGEVAAVRMAEVWLADAEGDPLLAVEILRALRAGDPSWLLHTRLLQPWVVSVVEVALRGRDPELASEFAAQAMLYSGRNPGAVTAAGLAAHAAGLAGDDMVLLERAVAVLAASPRRLMYARALADHGRALVRSGRRAQGVLGLNRAAEVFAEHGADREAALIDGLLRARGTPRRGAGAVARRPGIGWAALTPTEKRVARLVAAGHSNRSAAAELAISPHTVNTHLGAVFRKLQISTRVQLAKLLVDHGRHIP
ncbi:ATP-binding protein [Actinoplanes sp. RD1]|uniref:ATP-binding protein n=1 Tax=Actinoplanes sp. RD1 TaxID=3064538 RepID=UPI0027415003|nr:LuxR family transcriptional regulator [Actinoplanes sp. RD1]